MLKITKLVLSGKSLKSLLAPSTEDPCIIILEGLLQDTFLIDISYDIEKDEVTISYIDEDENRVPTTSISIARHHGVDAWADAGIHVAELDAEVKLWQN